MSNHSPGAAQASHKPVLLVVDGDEELRKVLNVALQHEGFDVWLAASGQEALEIHRHHLDWIDLFLIDVMMPGLSGPETLTALQEVDPRVCCCFMTDDVSHSRAEELMQRGAAGVFQKPLEVVELASALWQLLGERKPITRQAA